MKAERDMMTAFDESNIKRDGAGRFDEKHHSTPEISLGAAVDDTVMAVPATVIWTERGILPTPRHRKPQDVDRELDVELSIPNITSDDAPVGFTTTTTSFERVRHDDGSSTSEEVEVTSEVRTYDGKLYSAVAGDVDATPENLIPRAFYIGGFGNTRPRMHAGSAAASAEEAQAEVDSFVAIDGKLWNECGEPVYFVRTYGLGSNNGGTSLLVGDSTYVADEPGHTAPEHVFPAGQRDAAISYAQGVAQERGDSHSITRFQDAGRIEVSGAFQPGTSFVPAPRLSYIRPYQAKYVGHNYEPAPPGHVQREFDRFKAELISVPGAVVDVPDGWGGTAKRIDPTKLSADQAQDYKEYVELTSTI